MKAQFFVLTHMQRVEFCEKINAVYVKSLRVLPLPKQLLINRDVVRKWAHMGMVSRSKPKKLSHRVIIDCFKDGNLDDATINMLWCRLVQGGANV